MSLHAQTSLRERVYGLQRLELAQRIERHTSIRQLVQAPDVRIADIGCGRGYWLEQMRVWGAPERKLCGLDLDFDRIGEAGQRASHAALTVADARFIPFPDSCFHIVTQFTLFTSLLAARDRRAVACEMLRILRPGGWVLWHDFFAPNLWNRKTRRVGRAELRSLFPQCEITLEKVTLLPPLARGLAAISWRMAVLLERIPLLRTHYLAMIRKPA